MPRPNKGPRLERNSHGIYEIRWTENGRSKRVSTRTSALPEAQRVLAGWLLESEREQAGAWTVNQILDFYEREHLDAGKVAKPESERNRVRVIRAYFGDMLPSEIDAADVNEYVRRRRTGRLVVDGEPLMRKVTDSTIRRDLTTLVAAMNFASRQRKLDKREIPHIPMPAEAPPRDFWLTHEELDLLMEAAQPRGAKRLTRAYRFIAIARYTAARRNAIETLDWFRTKLDQRMIDYRVPGQRITKKRRVPVPIADELLPILKRAYAEKTSEYVLDHDGPIRKTFEAAVNRAAKAAEWRAEVAARDGDAAAAARHRRTAERLRRATPHVLRHTWATLAAQSGKVTLWEIAGVLGDTLATVERSYAHHCPDHLRGAVNVGRAGRSEASEESGVTG